MTRTVQDMEVKFEAKGRPKLRHIDTARSDINADGLMDVNIIDRSD